MVAENFCNTLEFIDYPYFKPLVKQVKRHSTKFSITYMIYTVLFVLMKHFNLQMRYIANNPR